MLISLEQEHTAAPIFLRITSLFLELSTRVALEILEH